MKLDQTVINQLRQPIYTVWDYIASEVGPIVGDDNLGAIELCIDAGRLSSIAENPQATQLIQDLVQEHKYIPVLEFLDKQIALV